MLIYMVEANRLTDEIQPIFYLGVISLSFQIIFPVLLITYNIQPSLVISFDFSCSQKVQIGSTKLKCRS